MSDLVAQPELCASRTDAHAESALGTNTPLRKREVDAFAPRVDLQTVRSGGLRDARAFEEAWKGLDETLCAYRPVLPLPPADLETRETAPWLEPVRFFGEPVRFAADRPLPSNCQHSIASALDDVTREVRTAAPNASGVDTPAAHASVPEGARCGVGGLGVLAAALLTGCASHDLAFACGFVTGCAVGGAAVSMLFAGWWRS